MRKPKMNLEELQELLRKAWSRETSGDPKHWTPENPAWWQCCNSALVGQDLLGGKVVRGDAKIGNTLISHYWNLLPDGREVDLTREQFPPETEIIRRSIKSRKSLLWHHEVRRRYVLLRLAVENQINPNPLFSDLVYQKCFEIAQTSECQKMKFGCIVVYKEKVVAATANYFIEPLKHLCEPECARFKIQSRTELMLGACGHAEEWALQEIHQKKIPPEDCSLYIAGFDAKTSKPWIKKEAADYTCLRCAVQMYMAGVGKIWVPGINRWESLTPKEAVEKSALYALKKKKI